jgi:hypothetical protein
VRVIDMAASNLPGGTGRESTVPRSAGAKK